MIRVSISTAAHLAAVILLFAASAVEAQPGRKHLKSFNGVSPERFYRSSVARWADQLALELAAAKAEFASAQVRPDVRQMIIPQADRTAAAASALAKVARRTSDRGQLYREFAPVEAEFTRLNDIVSRDGSIGVAFARSAYSFHQLSAALTEGDRDQGRGRSSAVRLAGALDDQAQELLSLSLRHLGPSLTRDVERSIRQFSRAARGLHRDIEATGNLAQAGEAFPPVGQAWGEVTGHLARIPNLPDRVRAQAVRIDGLYRRLGEKVAVILPQPEQSQAPPRPPMTWAPVQTGSLVVAAAEGGGPRVRVFPDPRGTAVFDFFAFDPEFRGGVRVATADLNGDGVPDVVAAPAGDHAPLVRVFDGNDMGLLAEFYGEDPNWTGGLTVAATDITRDGRALVAVAPDAGGGPVIHVFDLVQGKEVATITAFPAGFRGGVRLAWVDANRDGDPDVVAAPGPGDLPPVVRIFNIADGKPLTEFPVFGRSRQGSVWVAAAGGLLACGLDAGGPPLVRVFDLARPQKPLAEWLAFPEQFRGGVRVAMTDVDGRGEPDIVAAAGPGLPNSPVRVFSGRNRKPVADIPAFESFEGGSYAGGWTPPPRR